VSPVLNGIGRPYSIASAGHTLLKNVRRRRKRTRRRKLKEEGFT
tara:strand:- start:382 stop:513 length:132 start_codon:yes stop_codon:yes gene_type:complete